MGKKKNNSQVKNSEEKGKRQQEPDIDLLEEAEKYQEQVRKVNQNLKKDIKEAEQENKKSNLTKKILSQLPSVRKRKNSNSDSDCSTPTSRSSISEQLKHFIGHFKKAPKFTVDNQHIFRGYRVNYNSVKSVFTSMFHIHNESVNIWSHALGAIFVIGLMIYIVVSQNIFDFSPYKGHLVDDFQGYFTKLHSQFDILDHEISEYSQKFSENVKHLNEDLQKSAHHLHEKVTQIMVDLKNNEDLSIDHLTEHLAHLPQSIKHYLHVLEHVPDDIDIPSLDKFKSYFKEVQDTYMSHIIEKSLEKSTTGYALQDLPQWPIFAFLITAALCLIFSATFHLFFVYKEKYYKYFLRLDYAGVSLLISGSTMPLCYYGFYCVIELAQFYIALVGVACIFVFIVSLQDFIHTPKYWIAKSVMYASLGTFAAIPMFHLALHEKWYSEGDPYSSMPSMFYYSMMGLSYLGGLFIYVYRCPERYAPGHFDICGASHQIWHLSIVIAIVLTYIGVMINFYTRSNSICPLEAHASHDKLNLNFEL